MQERRATREMVESEQRSCGDENGVRLSRRATWWQVLEEAREIVARRADKPSGEGQLFDHRVQYRRIAQRAAQDIEQLCAGGRSAELLAVDTQTIGIQAQLEGFAEADEGIPSEPLAALDALEQVAWAQGRELQIRRYGRIGVGDDVEALLHPALLVRHAQGGATKNPSPRLSEMGSFGSLVTSSP